MNGDVDVWLMSLSPPAYNGEGGAIDTTLAEKGAVLFHERNLWADGANADIPKVSGNGSCASCHGVYSPRHAADPAYLPEPRLKGIAGVITPTESCSGVATWNTLPNTSCDGLPPMGC